jgi:CheY-like chemotaxis protein
MTRVLIAEDNAVNRELLRELLEGRGLTVAEACNGEEALDMIEETPPDILLLDLGMPVLDGFAVVRKVRENPRLANLPVLAVTAYAMHGDREKVLSSGFDGYLSKPISSQSLAEELDRLLSKPGGRNATPKQSYSKQANQKAAGNNE